MFGDDDSGYDLTDPKHPSYHDRMSSLADQRRIVDRTPWPTHDGAGNSLRHTEDCAWRFGGECDCGG